MKPLGLLARFADRLMTPLMYALSGTFFESPQRTHWWNYMKFRNGELNSLNQSLTLFCPGIPGNILHTRLSRHHLPILGGWRNYVVLEPCEHGAYWYVGWISGDITGISQITLKGRVRLLIGPTDTTFFGISAIDESQIAIKKVGDGRIGNGGPYCHVPLL